MFRVDPRSGFFDPPTPIIDVGESNDSSRCHCILPHPHNASHFYVVDDGRNAVTHMELIYNPDLTKWSYIVRSMITIKSPRTLAFHPTVQGVMYVSQEEPNHVSVVRINEKTYRLESVAQTVSTLPTIGYLGVNAKPSHVDTDRMGKYLYVANRDGSGSDVAANNMAVFRYVN